MTMLSRAGPISGLVTKPVAPLPNPAMYPAGAGLPKKSLTLLLNMTGSVVVCSM